MSDNFIPMSSYLAGELGRAIGNYANQYGVAAAAEDGTGDTCTCQGNCSGVACQNNCAGGCKGVSCQSTCSGGCTSGCKGSCASSCSGNCSGTCANGCETYCAGICQTYCQHDQTYSTNDGRNSPGGSVFSWTNSNEHGETINILASDWNKLASYVEDAASYCSTSSISITRATSGGLITAAIFNSLDGGIGKLNSAGSVGTKTKNVDLIKDEDINALASNYNDATIRSSLPSNSSGSANKCCQNGMSCMTQASGRPSLQPCNQKTNYQCSKRQ